MCHTVVPKAKGKLSSYISANNPGSRTINNPLGVLWGYRLLPEQRVVEYTPYFLSNSGNQPCCDLPVHQVNLPERVVQKGRPVCIPGEEITHINYVFLSEK